MKLGAVQIAAATLCALGEILAVSGGYIFEGFEGLEIGRQPARHTPGPTAA